MVRIKRYFKKNWEVGLLVSILVLAMVGWVAVGRISNKPEEELLLIGKEGSEATGEVTHSFPLYNEPEVDNLVTMTVTGDVMLGRSVYKNMLKVGDYTYPFRRVGGMLSLADITLINLENPLIDPCPVRDGGMVFCAPTKVVAGLLYAGVDVANLANNHIDNYGGEGVSATRNALRENKIEASDSETLAIINKNGVRFGFIGFNLLVRGGDMEKVARDVAAAKGKVDVLIVSSHWGAEYKHSPGVEQKSQARAIVEAGADVIVGTHPHVLQSVEMVNGALVIYSLGNFVFDQSWSIDTREGAVGRLVFKAGKLESYDFLPILIGKDFQPAVATEAAAIAKMNSYLEGSDK